VLCAANSLAIAIALSIRFSSEDDIGLTLACFLGSGLGVSRFISLEEMEKQNAEKMYTCKIIPEYI
jgi:hypothetical protein